MRRVLRVEPSQPAVRLSYDFLNRVLTTITTISTSDTASTSLVTTNTYYADGALHQQTNSAIGGRKTDRSNFVR
jgi:hypothetical protein